MHSVAYYCQFFSGSYIYNVTSWLLNGIECHFKNIYSLTLNYTTFRQKFMYWEKTWDGKTNQPKENLTKLYDKFQVQTNK